MSNYGYPVPIEEQHDESGDYPALSIATCLRCGAAVVHYDLDDAVRIHDDWHDHMLSLRQAVTA